MKKPKVFLIVTEHFDLMWRRCFDRDIAYKEQCFISYADLQRYYIIDNIELCKKYSFYKFEIESVAVLKKFLEKNPEHSADIEELFKSGQLYVAMSGINIIDSNMVWGESIIRNFLYGQKYLKDNFSFVPQGMDRNDAFGNSAQLPQIARGFGTRWIYNVSYSPSDKPYWRGLDGSTIYNFIPRCIGTVGAYYKYRPCPECGGNRDKHCSVCNDRRIDVDYMEGIRQHKYPTENEVELCSDIPGYIHVGGEEILPVEEPVKWALENRDKFDIVFANYEDFLPYFKDKTDDADTVDETELHSSAELNVNNTGCYVSRIKIKQLNRRLENKLQKTEALCVQSYLKNEKYPYASLEKIWNNQLFINFHDAITATHVDAAYAELLDAAREEDILCGKLQKEAESILIKQADDVITVFNPYGMRINTKAAIRLLSNSGIELVDENGEGAVITAYERRGDTVNLEFAVNAIEPFSQKSYKVVKKDTEYYIDTTPALLSAKRDSDAVFRNERAGDGDSRGDCLTEYIENSYYRITADNNGIVEIYDKVKGASVLSEGEYRVGEWILEHDEGSPWATLSNDMRRQGLKRHTMLTNVKKNDNVQALEFNIDPGERAAYSIGGLYICYSVFLEKDSDMIYFKAKVDWDTQNQRLRIAFPINSSGEHIYEIPYGMLERKPYEPDCVSAEGETNWASAAGDYPAINWAGVQDKALSVAVFNKGTPSYQINKDDTGKENIYLSVLRSPSLGTYLNEPRQYSMLEYDGMRDAGEHEFEYAVKVYTDTFDNCTVVADAIGYNADMAVEEGVMQSCPLPAVIGNNAYISSVKGAESGNGLIFRVTEYRGKGANIRIAVPGEFAFDKVYETNMNEEIKGELCVADGEIELNISPFEIKSVYFKI